MVRAMVLTASSRSYGLFSTYVIESLGIMIGICARLVRYATVISVLVAEEGIID